MGQVTHLAVCIVEQVQEHCSVLVGRQKVGQIIFRDDFVQRDGSQLHEVADVEIPCMDVTVAPVLDGVLCHSDSGVTVHVYG